MPMITVLTPHHIVLFVSSLLFYTVPANKKTVPRLEPRDVFMTTVKRVPTDVIPIIFT